MRANGPTYARTRRLFLRALGLVYLAAFLSLRWQIGGLVGEDGILPAADFLARAQSALGADAAWRVPSLFWLDASDATLHGVCVAGVAASVLLVGGVAPLAMLVVLWVLYLSLVGVGQQFLSYQWDALLLETGFLAIFWAPLAWRLDAPSTRRPSPIVLWLLRWLLFRLMFFSGFVKLASGDPTWWNLTALEVHYATQPLPVWTSWYAHQLPGWFQKIACGAMFVVELGLPLGIVLGRRARLIAFSGLVALQLGIAATGNYGFFNLLAVVLCLPLLDDAHLAAIWPRGRRYEHPLPVERRWKLALDVVVAAATLSLSVPLSLAQLTELRVTALPPVARLLRTLGPFHLTGTYGLFAVMTTRRPELTIEGSVDGVAWHPYVFRWKPGPLDRRPAFVGFGMPRLDWQMWFDALYVERMLESGRGSSNLITPALLERLRARSPVVLDLLAGDPFVGEAPHELRWRLDDYRFTTPEERAASGAQGVSGNWWRRTLIHAQPAQ